MDYLVSLRMFLAGLVKRFLLLFASIALDPFDFAERFFKVTYAPQWLAWLLFGLVLSIAVFLAYHDLRKENVNLQGKLQKEEWEYKRQHLIEQRKPYLNEIIPILTNLRKRTRQLVEIRANENVPKEILDEIIIYTYQETGGIGNTLEQQKMHLFEQSLAMDARKIGLTKIEKDDAEWQALMERLNNCRVSDLDLEESIKDFCLILNGANSYMLYDLYRKPYSQQDKLRELTKTEGAMQTTDIIINRAFTRVVRRIEQLLNGDPAK